jgi:hypothetical protein
MLCDEEGLLKNRTLNIIATAVYNYGRDLMGELCPIVGNVVFMRNVLTEDGYDYVSLTRGNIDYLLRTFEGIFQTLTSEVGVIN